ncbi:glycosyl transferase [Nitrosopumilus sp. b1]|uniref:glycosyltransferase family 2 protein n=1 Tax=Nitrosopumilus sp. b1 TaxID=2109907 RepID=UPI0015F3B7EA|nr:glycosyltransferase [Nitrosopumilus sp. b1]KAF6243378.1 glycosyl transferase [Nitrosopumilus sp. b1]
MGIGQYSKVEVYNKIQDLIESCNGDVGRLQFIQKCLREGKTLYHSDEKYLLGKLESTVTPLSPTEVDDQKLIKILTHLIEWNLGDVQRLEFIKSSLKKHKPLYKSDEKYLKSKLESLSDNKIIAPVLFKPEPPKQLEKSFEKPDAPIQKCSKCKEEIKFSQPTKRVNDMWYHAECNVQIIPPKQNVSAKPDSPKSTTLIETASPEIMSKKPSKSRPDPLLVGVAGIIFALLIYTAYSMFTYLSIIAISFAAALVFYHLLSSKIYKKEERNYGTHRMSVYSIMILVLPFAFGAMIAFDGYVNFMSIIQAVFVWMLTLSFWQTMLFVPLAIRSVHLESQMKDPDVFPLMSVLIPAYNEEKVIQLTIDSLLNADYPHKEIIVIDDGSTDKTLEIARLYKDKVKVLHKENGGKASALNYGLVFSKGDIVVVVDADTVIGRQALKNIAKGFRNENVAAVAGNIKIRNKVNWLTWCQALDYLTGIQIMRRALDYFGAITIVPGALGAFSKKKLEQAGAYHKDTIVEDFDATMKLLKSGLIVQASSNAVAYTQAPQTLRDFYKQRKRWYRGNLQVMTRHADALTNPRFGSLQRFAYPLMIIHMLVIPTTSIMVWGFAAYQALTGQYEFVAYMVGLFILLQYLLGVLAVRMDGDEKKMVAFSAFLVIGYKQIIDVLQLKAAIEELLRRKATWTSAARIRS